MVRLIDGALTWFIRVWVALQITANIILAFAIPDSASGALFHVGWVPIVPIPHLANFLWLAGNLLGASPAAVAAMVRQRLRYKATIIA